MILFLAFVTHWSRPYQAAEKFPRFCAKFLTLPIILITLGITSVVPAATLQLTAATILDINAAFDAETLTSERLVELYRARIVAYDNTGPNLNAIITLNPKATETARALDKERGEQGPRSLLHGIPVVLKDNIDTGDMPTTAGSFLLKGSIPPDDAFIVQKLRAAGAIILAKVNMSEFASGGAMSSLGGPMANPHDLTKSPSGSSGGTGVAIAAAYAQVGLGTDTGGSIRGPSTANGIVGLKPTHGLMSRDGIIPLALSFDMAGPMGRSVYDIAAMLGVMTGVDVADSATRKSEGKFKTDYTQYLDENALSGARIGVARNFLEQDPEVDWVIEASLLTMKSKGATLIDVALPDWLLESSTDFYWVLRHREFRAQIPDYLSTLEDDDYPKDLAEMLARASRLVAPIDGAHPNPSRWSLMRREHESGELTDYEYQAVYNYALPLVRTTIDGLMRSENLDAIVYATSPRRPAHIDPEPSRPGNNRKPSPIRIANLTGFPDLVVPAGFTGRGLPIGISFLGRAFSEPRLLALGYAFEQATRSRRTPVNTPPLPGETLRESN